MHDENRTGIAAADGVNLDVAVREPAGHVEHSALLVHGITADRDEYGMFVRLAEGLAAAGFGVLRFSFRGHGKSGGSSRGATIAGERLDLDAALTEVQRRWPGGLSVVAASFGAVATLLALPSLGDVVERLVFWNPVLDLQRTFVEPELPWGVANFGPGQRAALRRDGVLRVDGEFELGRVMVDEFALYDPLPALLATTVPVLVVHGDRDTAVSYDIARDAVATCADAVLHTIVGSDHGFDSREREDEAIAVTVEWLTRPA